VRQLHRIPEGDRLPQDSTNRNYGFVDCLDDIGRQFDQAVRLGGVRRHVDQNLIVGAAHPTGLATGNYITTGERFHYAPQN
jgi:hypothetical protein